RDANRKFPKSGVIVSKSRAVVLSGRNHCACGLAVIHAWNAGTARPSARNASLADKTPIPTLGGTGLVAETHIPVDGSKRKAPNLGQSMSGSAAMRRKRPSLSLSNAPGLQLPAWMELAQKGVGDSHVSVEGSKSWLAIEINVGGPKTTPPPTTSTFP